MSPRRVITTGAVVALSLLLGGNLGPAQAHGAHTVDIVNNGGNEAYAYEPALTEVDVGGTVTFVNPPDRAPIGPAAERHPTVCIQGQSNGDCPWSTADIPPGAQETIEFPEPGTFSYFCAIHPYMEGQIVVGDGVPPSDEPRPAPAPTPTVSPSPTPEPSASSTPTDSPSAEPSAPAKDPASDEPVATASSAPTVSEHATPSTDATAVNDAATNDDRTLTAIEGVPDKDSGGAPKAIAGVLVLAVGVAVMTQFRKR